LHNEHFWEKTQILVRISCKAVTILDLREGKLNSSCRFRRGFRYQIIQISPISKSLLMRILWVLYARNV